MNGEESSNAGSRPERGLLAALRRSRNGLAAFVAANEAGVRESEDDLLDEAAACLARCLALFRT